MYTFIGLNFEGFAPQMLNYIYCNVFSSMLLLWYFIYIVIFKIYVIINMNRLSK